MRGSSTAVPAPRGSGRGTAAPARHHPSVRWPRPRRREILGVRPAPTRAAAPASDLPEPHAAWAPAGCGRRGRVFGRVLSALEQPACARDGDRGRAILDAKLVVDVRDLPLDGVDAARASRCDLFVGLPENEQAQHLDLRGREP